MTLLSHRKSRRILGERRNNLEGARVYGEGRHQQVNEIPFTIFQGTGRRRPL